MNLQEALSTAIGFEHKVRDHYAQCMRKIADPKGRKIFETLAKEEQGHVTYLETRLSEWKKTGMVEDAELPTILPPAARVDLEVKKLKLKAGHVPTAPNPEMEFLKQALELERTTSAFYGGLFDQLEPRFRHMFERFLEIEQGHVLIVQAEIDALAGLGHWFDFMEFTLEGA